MIITNLNNIIDSGHYAYYAKLSIFLEKELKLLLIFFFNLIQNSD
jgi:hypothetical protein